MTGADRRGDTRGAWLLGVDAGLTNLKAALFRPDGTEAAVRASETPVDRPAPGREEVDPDALWEAVAGTIGDVLAEGPATPAAVAAVGVAGHGHGLYALGSGGEPVRPGIRSTDSRATGLVEEWEEAGLAAEMRAALGYEPFGADPLSLLGWLHRHEPAAYDALDRLVFCKDYLKYRLTGRVCTDEMEGSVFVDPDTGDVATGLLDSLGLGAVAGALPEVVPSWEVCGEVTDAAAAATGLDPGTPVASGLHDVGAVALGAGAHEPGQGVLIVGTWGQSIVVLDSPGPGDNSGDDGDTGVGLTRRYLDGGWLRYRGNRSATASLDWFVEQCGGEWQRRAEAEGVSPYEIYERVVDGVPAGSEGLFFHPYLHGSTDDPAATGGFYGLTADHTTAHMLRAIYEGIAISQVERLTQLGSDLSAVRLSGGGARSDLWAGMFADVFGDEVVVPAGEETGARGAAICAAIAAGCYPDHETAVAEMVTAGRRYDPDPATVERYRHQRETFEELLSAVRPLWGRLAPEQDRS